MGTIHLTKAEFLSKVANYEANPNEWKYVGDKPCIIDFYAAWCGPCKTIAPILEDLAKEYDGQIYIYKVDTEAEQELAGAFGIHQLRLQLDWPERTNRYQFSWAWRTASRLDRFVCACSARK